MTRSSHQNSLYQVICVGVLAFFLSPDASFSWALPAPDDLVAKIEGLKKQILATSPLVCGKTEPADADEKALFTQQKTLLTQTAKNLIKLLDQRKAEVEKGNATASEKAAAKDSLDADKKALQADCPMLPAAEREAAARSESGTSPSSASRTKLNLSIPLSSLDFGHQAVQTESASKTVTITNTSGGEVNLAPPVSTVTSSDYKITENTCVNTLQDKANCTFKVTYAPFSMDSEENYVGVVSSADISTFRNKLEALRQARVRTARAKEDLENIRKKDEPKTLQARRELDTAALAVDTAAKSLRDLFDVVVLSGTPDHWKYPLTRAVVGLDLSAPTSRTIKQAYFVDFDLLAPVVPFAKLKRSEDPLENRLWLWFNPRITSLPQAANFSALSTINETGSFFDQLKNNGKLNDIAQGLDISGGPEFILVKPRDGIPWWGEYPNTQARLSPSLIAGVGISTPFSTDNTDVPAQVNQTICDAFAAPAGSKVSSNTGLVCTLVGPNNAPLTSPAIVAPDGSQKAFINFFTPDRSRFFRRAYAGVRLKTYFFSKDIQADCIPPVSRRPDRGGCDAPYDIFPGIIDLTVGKDEAVTGGHMTTWLFRIDAVYPLPFYQGIHIFGSVYTGLTGNRTTPPFNSYNVQAPAAGSNNDANTFRFPLQPLNRDYFRVGIGVDLIQLFKKAANGGQPSADAPAAPKSDAPPSPKTTAPNAPKSKSTTTGATDKKSEKTEQIP